MSFSSISFDGNVSGSLVSGFDTLVTSGSFLLTVSGGNTGAVTGTWSFNGTYNNHDPYYPNSGSLTLSGSVTGTGGQSGPWVLTLGGKGAETDSLTLSYSGGQWSLSGQAGFQVDYTVTTGYDAEYSYHNHYRFTPAFSVAGSAPGTTSATDGNDNLTGTTSGDTIAALGGNDTITGGIGNDSIDGGSGIDTAVFSDVRANYTISHSGSAWTVTHTGSDGVDTLTNVERLQFSDSRLALDVSGDAGMAYRLYKAAFNREPDVPGLGYQMNQLDQGFTLSQVANAFIASPEFQAKYGSAVSDTAFITLLYENVLGREPEADGLAFHLNELATGQSRADVLTHFSESPENQANVLGQIQDGMVYSI